MIKVPDEQNFLHKVDDVMSYCRNVEYVLFKSLHEVHRVGKSEVLG